MESFEEWFESIRPEIDGIQKILNKPMGTDMSVLVDQLVQVECRHSRINVLLAEANTYLDLAERDRLPLKEEYDTVLDRKTELAARVVDERRVRNILQALSEAIKSRLILGMSMQKSYTAERLGRNTP